MPFNTNALLLSLAPLASAQFGPGGHYGPGGQNNPYNGGNAGDDRFGRGNFGSFYFMSDRQKMLTVHGVLASLAFVLFFPLGSILIRLGQFRGLWLVHGLFQIFAYLVYTAAFGIGIWMVNNTPVSLVGHHHPTIGIIVFCLLFFQPILGAIHHFQFKKYQRRTIWSYGHLWLGRIVVTLGIINGGLGMLMAAETGVFVPQTGQMIAYGVVAGIMWLAWLAAVVIGERRRGRAARKNAELGGPAYGSREHYAHYRP